MVVSVAKATSTDYYTSGLGVASGAESYYLDAGDEFGLLRFVTREEWLVAAIDAMRPWFTSIGADLPRSVRVSVGFTIGTASENALTRGVTYTRAASTDDTNHVFVSPELGDAAEVLRTLLHELVHVCDDCASGHRGAFAHRAKALGLVGSMTSSQAGPVLTAELCTLAAVLGEYPHAPMQVTRAAGRRPRVGAPTPVGGSGGSVSGGSGPRPQGTRNVKIVCLACGNTARTTRKWIDAGLTPLCPCNHTPRTAS
jgi:hypothetical protein